MVVLSDVLLVAQALLLGLPLLGAGLAVILEPRLRFWYHDRS